MPRISTFAQRRLPQLRRRSQTDRHSPQNSRSTYPFRYDASIRIADVGNAHANITRVTGLVPTHSHLKGEARSRFNRHPYAGDLWTLSSPLAETATIGQHCDWLWEAIRPHREYFETVIAAASSADVCLGCLSESIYPFLEVDASSLTILREMKLGLTFNFTCV